MSKLINQPLGVGLGYRHELRHLILDHQAHIQVLEITPEHYIEGASILYVPELELLKSQFNLVLHGVSANIVSTTRPDWEYFGAIKKLLHLTNSPYFSDHAAMTCADGFQIGFFTPTWYDKTTLEHTLAKVKAIETFLEVPVVLEYIAYTTLFPGSPWTPEQFYLELAHAHPQLGVLLDLTNVWYNGLNFHFDAQQFIDDLPAEQIVHVHLAGGELIDGLWYDSHSTPVHQEVFDLYDQLCRKTAVDCTIIERDDEFDTAGDSLKNDLNSARIIWRKHQQAQLS